MISTVVPTSRSQQAFQRAQKVITGGVNSPVRSCAAVNRHPVFVDRADGPYLWDLDGNRYIDYVGSWGPMILGHRHPRILEAIEDVLERSTSFGAPCVDEIELAEMINHAIPSMELMRMVNSGTEATMSAVRVARAFTGRQSIVKFDGCYHGHADYFLVKAGSGLATLSISNSDGVPEQFVQATISLPYNDLASVERAFVEHPDKIAAVIVEPVLGNAGLILPKEKYLAGLRELTTKYGALLIFDEVMTGFRVAYGGAQERYEIRPDLTCLGKIIGGGIPVGAYGGRREIMELVAPLGPVYQAGTLSGNPLAMAAGAAQLKALQAPSTYQQLGELTHRLTESIRAIAQERSMALQVSSITGMLSIFFTDSAVVDLRSAQSSDTTRFAQFWQLMMDKGIYWPPSQFESAFVSLVHSKQDIDDTVLAFKESLSAMA